MPQPIKLNVLFAEMYVVFLAAKSYVWKSCRSWHKKKNINWGETHFFFMFVFNSLQFTMTTLFLYKDGHGNVVDENGGPEPME